ncbi:MAG: efflux RND transporter periplasmic adaptor subunit [Mangrovibacterium sp.]
MKTSGKISIATIVVVVIAGTTYKLIDVKRDKKDTINLVNKSKSEVPVTVVSAKYSDVTYDISYHGTFEPNCEVTVVSEAQGKVEDFSMEEGFFIAEGKVIAWLENDILSYQVESAKAACQKAHSDLQRFENLTPGEAVSTRQLEDARLAFTNAKNAWLTLKKQYDDSFIKAPVSGTVCRRYIEKGTFIAPGTPVADIVDTRKMKFVAWFGAADRVRVKADQQVKISAELYPDTFYNGIIKTVSIKPDESKRYRVQAEVENNLDQPLIPGIDGLLTLSLKQDRKNIIIPRNCVIGSVLEPTVYVVKDGVVNARKVVIAEIINAQAIIESGLSEGEQIALSGQINLEDNTKVSISGMENE